MRVANAKDRATPSRPFAVVERKLDQILGLMRFNSQLIGHDVGFPITTRYRTFDDSKKNPFSHGGILMDLKGVHTALGWL